MKEKEAAGYLTVYLAMSLTVILSLFFTLIEGARMNAIRMQIELVSDAAMNSVLGEFHREMHKQYDMFFVDESYGTDSPSDQRVKEHLEKYICENYSQGGYIPFGYTRTFTGLQTDSLEITGTRCAADNDADAIRQQVYAYMSADQLGKITAQVLSDVDKFNGLGLESGEWQNRKAENDNRMEEMNEKADKKKTEIEDAGGDSNVGGDSNPAEKVDALRTTLALDQVLGTGRSISDTEIDTGECLSHRDFHTGTGLEPDNTHDYDRADAVVFDEFILEKCSNYKEEVKQGKLSYEVEYILFGDGSDEANLNSMALRLLLVREAANCIYIFSDSGKCAEAEAVALAITTVLLVPEAAEAVKAAILFAWAYIESIQDVKTLFAGGKVPLMKNSSTWSTSLTNVLSSSVTAKGDTDGSGLSYKDYLRVFLFLENGSQKNYRLMDVMEMDIRETECNENFRIDWCMDAFGISSVTSSSFGYSYPMKREISYN